MKLSTEQQNKVVSWLNEKWSGGKQCHVCQHHDWSVSDMVYQLSEFSNMGLVVGGPVQPLITVTCVNCGNTLLLNALTLGILEQDVQGIK